MAVLFYEYIYRTIQFVLLILSYRLQVSTNFTPELYNAVTDLLGLIPDAFEAPYENQIWIYTKEVKESEPGFDFINEFLDIIEPKFSKLEELGIKRNDILIWKLYGYDQQCNMEFDPQRMKRLGDNGITLCISCWEE